MDIKFSKGYVLVSEKHFDALCEGMAEIKATNDGFSDQPIANIICGVLDEINEADDPIFWHDLGRQRLTNKVNRQE